MKASCLQQQLMIPWENPELISVWTKRKTFWIARPTHMLKSLLFKSISNSNVPKIFHLSNFYFCHQLPFYPQFFQDFCFWLFSPHEINRFLCISASSEPQFYILIWGFPEIWFYINLHSKQLNGKDAYRKAMFYISLLCLFLASVCRSDFIQASSACQPGEHVFESRLRQGILYIGIICMPPLLARIGIHTKAGTILYKHHVPASLVSRYLNPHWRRDYFI